jgi:DNA-binding MarR family transcriptional regulator
MFGATANAEFGLDSPSENHYCFVYEIKGCIMLPYEECILFLLGRAYYNARRRLKRRLLGYGLTPIQHLVLELLMKKEGLSAGEIGEMLFLDSATLSGVLHRMAQKGWITKETDNDDRRFVRLYLTEKGREMRPVLLGERERLNEEVLAGFTLEEKVLLKRLLKDLQ